MGARFQICCAAEPNSLPVMRGYIDATCDRFPHISAQACYDLKLAVDEACTNVIQYGYVGMNPGTLILAFEIEPTCVSLTITDFGHPFEPSEPEAPDIQTQYELGSAHGFGLFFIYQAMDEIDYETSEAGNVLSFLKRLDA